MTIGAAGWHPDGKLHAQIVRVLAIVNAVAVTGLAGCEQVGIPAAWNRPGLEAQHAAHAEAPGANSGRRAIAMIQLMLPPWWLRRCSSPPS